MDREEPMCGRYTLSKGEKIIEAVPNVTIREDLRKHMEQHRFNIAPTQDVLVAVQIGDKPELQVMQWGLIPSWAKDAAIASQLINARAETISEKPAFRKAFERRRCVVPADGFYEWRMNSDGSKTPVYIRLKSHRGFGFASLWETWRDGAGEPVHTCTIITTPANAMLTRIHNRMPAILSPEAVRQWLNPAAQPADELRAQLKPFPADEMEMQVVSRAVNTAAREGPELIQPVEDAPAEPKSGGKAKSSRGKSKPSSQESLF
jgi:putative SOS response-associated peptidase YedK